MPKVFQELQSEGYINASDVLKTRDGFRLIYKSLSDILAEKGVLDFPGSDGQRLACNRFFDDWFLYAVEINGDYTYGLLKLREQEHDIEDGLLSDGDTPGVTISFISFSCDILLKCLENTSDKNVKELDNEINRVVASKGQRHNKLIKNYFKNPASQASYLVAQLYTKHIASFADNGFIVVPDIYKEIFKQSVSCKTIKKLTRIPKFIESLNESVKSVVCDNEKIYIKNKAELTEYEQLAILATHTGNTSLYSFAAEVEYHARFLTPIAKIKIPFLGKSIYNSAIRADMTIGDNEFEGPAPFYNSDSKIVKRQCSLHAEKLNFL